MKRIIIIVMSVSLLLLCGCNAGVVSTPDSTEQPTLGTPDVSETGDNVPGTTIDWELPIDVDDSATEPVGNSEATTAPTPTDPGTSGNDVQPTTAPSNNQDPSEPTLTEPPTTVGGEQVEDPAESEPTVEPSVPETTVPQPSFNQSTSGPIELPMIPG